MQPHLRMEKKFELLSDSKALVQFRHELQVLLKDSGLDEKSAGEVLLAVQEALTNILRHAYKGAKGIIEVFYKDSGSEICLSIKDRGTKFDLTQIADPKLPREQPGGLGIYFIKQVMDRVEYDASFQEGNLIHLTKWKTAGRSAGNR